MKNFAAFLLFCMASMGLWAAESSEKNWSLYKIVDGVEIYFQELSCDDPANGLFEVYTIFKIVNTNEVDVSISYSMDVRFAGHWYRAEDTDTPLHTLSIGAGESMSGSCGNGALSVFDRFSDRPDRGAMDEFVWNNIRVTK